MTLPLNLIDELFLRLSNTYGNYWDSMWSLNDINEVKELWASELSFFSNKMYCFKWAIENLPERPPNLIQFKNLLLSAPKLNSDVYIPTDPGVPPPIEIREKINALRKQFSTKV